MIKANELRAGNLLYSNLTERFFICTSEDIYNLSMDCNAKNASYVKLTEEWLLKAGFKKSPANNSYYISIPKIKSEIHFELFRGDFVCVLYSSTGSFIPSEIKYVHELQNLFRSNTGEELVFSCFLNHKI